MKPRAFSFSRLRRQLPPGGSLTRGAHLGAGLAHTEKKASPVQGEVARQRRDGGVVKSEKFAEVQSLSRFATAPFAQGSLRREYIFRCFLFTFA